MKTRTLLLALLVLGFASGSGPFRCPGNPSGPEISPGECADAAGPVNLASVRNVSCPVEGIAYTITGPGMAALSGAINSGETVTLDVTPGPNRSLTFAITLEDGSVAGEDAPIRFCVPDHQPVNARLTINEVSDGPSASISVRSSTCSSTPVGTMQKIALSAETSGCYAVTDYAWSANTGSITPEEGNASRAVWKKSLTSCTAGGGSVEITLKATDNHGGSTVVTKSVSY